MTKLYMENFRLLLDCLYKVNLVEFNFLFERVKVYKFEKFKKKLISNYFRTIKGSRGIGSQFGVYTKEGEEHTLSLKEKDVKLNDCLYKSSAKIVEELNPLFCYFATTQEFELATGKIELLIITMSDINNNKEEIKGLITRDYRERVSKVENIKIKGIVNPLYLDILTS